MKQKSYIQTWKPAIKTTKMNQIQQNIQTKNGLVHKKQISRTHVNKLFKHNQWTSKTSTATS